MFWNHVSESSLFTVRRRWILDVDSQTNEAYPLCSLMNLLLMKLLNRLVEIDDFMAGLWKVHLAVKAEGYAQVRYDLLQYL